FKVLVLQHLDNISDDEIDRVHDPKSLFNLPTH
ncbi:MAG: hypothetical protein ACI85N_002047, partial [Gammaproteobacteria bacterium]